MAYQYVVKGSKNCEVVVATELVEISRNGMETIMERLWKSDLGNGTFKNPILYADYSDPDVIRVGDTFYMTASSFNYIPGLPILISKDLVNWQLANYAIRRIDYEVYDTPQHAKGVWAPAIRYHDGEFYIYYGMPDEGIFMVKTKDALGEWEKPVLVLEGKGLIDPCPFWDEDGRAYVIHGYAKSRIGFKSYLGIFPMSYDGKSATAPDRILYNGVETQPTIEGPKVYRKNGYYYIFAPAGGVRTGWQTVLRSKYIYGPYEEKIVMKQGDTETNGPHQGGLTDTKSGQEWFVHFQDKGLYGRIVHLQPVRWKDDWPVIGVDEDEEGCGRPCSVYEKPDMGQDSDQIYLEASDDFAGETLGLQWQWLGNAKDSYFSLNAKPGYLRLFCKNPSGKAEPILWENANVLTQKLVCPYFQAETLVEIGGLQEKTQAGMVMMGGHYAYVAVRMKDGVKKMVYAQSFDGEKGMEEETTYLCDVDASAEKVWIRERLDRNGFFMEYSLDGKNFEKVSMTFMPTDHTWVGAKIGLFANAVSDRELDGYADFEYIHVENI